MVLARTEFSLSLIPLRWIHFLTLTVLGSINVNLITWYACGIIFLPYKGRSAH